MSVERSTDRSSSAVQVIRSIEGVRWGRLGLAALSGAISGLTESLVLVAVVRLAVSLTEDVGSFELPIVGFEVSTAELFLATVALSFVRVGADLFGVHLASIASLEVIEGLRRRLLRAFVSSSWDVQARQREGELIELLAAHTGQVGGLVQVLVNGLSATASLVLIVGAAFAVDAVGATLLIVLGLVLFAALRPISALSKRHSGALAEGHIELAGQVSEIAALSMEVQVFGVGESALRPPEAVLDSLRRPIYLTRLYSRLTPTLYGQAALLLILGGLAATYAIGNADAAALGAIVLLLVRALQYSSAVQGTYQRIHECAPFVERLNDEIGRFDASPQRTEGQDIDRIGPIEFRDVGFSYTPGQPVLSDVCATIAPGAMVAIVGRSGSGKSTLTQLLLMLREPTEGEILLGGVPMRSVRPASFHRRAAVVPQDSLLIAGTVRENIAFFRDIPDEDIVAAARAAHIHDDIVSWPLGYDTHVGERRGAAVSGGQRQRISLARALAGQPDLIVLDEPTSALDNQSELLVRDTLEGLHGAVTLVIIAHRMSTIRSCDEVLVLEEGRLLSAGPPDASAEDSGYYRHALEADRT